MAVQCHNTTIATSPPCRTASDVRARTAQVLAWRDRIWPARRPRLEPATPPAPTPVARPAVSAPSLPARSDIATGRTSVREVIHVTAAHFGLPVDHLLVDMRTQPLVRRRQIAMFIAHKLTGRSYPYIGSRFAGRDHTTVLHGVRTVQARIDAGDVETVEAVNAIVEQLTGGANV